MVSVIITTYGGNRKLIRAIKSVLRQSYENYEIIVVDDNDPETMARIETRKMMKQFSDNDRVAYICHERNRNGAAARNTGISAAKGKYIAFLDDDDVFLPDRVKKAISFLKENRKAIGVLYGVVSVRDNKLVSIIRHNNGEYLMTSKILEDINHSIGSGSNIFILAETVKEVGGFDERFQRFQDIEFMLRICEKGEVFYQNSIEIIKEETEIRNLNYKKVRYAYELFMKKFKKQICKEDIKIRNRLETSVRKYKWIFYLEKKAPHFIRVIRYIKHCKSDYYCNKELSEIEHDYIYGTWKCLNT